ncbi:geranylgeranylglyceryl/heptaprenylglyceryl phosphate synthase [Luteibaculum oceani]|uniref:Geranylgeranylglyceryl phosphate synthase family protein n=1 Tax=Luteibaculum oceani TaxID=1294296 RepID=A0A5C6UZI0_9FLAO|nr:geranylgeranylglyceryl/heptaprenylglyceryl phosphate synthase [Luteibaculum oceani]TXC78843.1 geranylgeranylglyceryl phosphate synthase family protein [Luteibaculum oceani]
MPGRVKSLKSSIQNPSFAVLIDPEKETDLSKLGKKIDLINQSLCALVLVGASSNLCNNFEEVTKFIQQRCDKPIIGFPGKWNQVNKYLDGLLFISLISSDRYKYLFQEQSKAIETIDKIESIDIYPTGYMVLDGGIETSVEKVSGSKGMRYDDISAILTRIKTGRFLGMDHIYLEAGSGAKSTVPCSLVSEVAQQVDSFLIVGGGVKSAEKVSEFWNAGAHLVVIGNAIEQDPNIINEISIKCQLHNEVELK